MTYNSFFRLKPLKVVSIFLLLAIGACEKEFTQIGNQIRPESENFQVRFIDSTTFRAHTLFDDSVKINNQSISLLGSYLDPIFGLSTASFLTQVRLLKANTVFPDTVAADSLILKLNYNQSYRNRENPVSGDLYKSGSAIFVSVYLLNNSLSVDTTYYSDFEPEDYYSEEDLLVRTYLKPTRNGYIDITLPYWLADTLLNADSAHLVENDVFLEYFKGIYIKAEPVIEDGIIYSISASTSSSLSLFYSHETDTVSTEYAFSINSLCAKVNVFEHDYENSKVLNIGDTLTQDTVIYLQAMSGLKSMINIPYFNSWLDSTDIVINKAELTFYVQEEEPNNKFSVPTELILKGINTDGGEQYIPEYIGTSQTGDLIYEGEAYSSETKGYTFNIASYLQDLINKTNESRGFYLYPSARGINARRVILKSGSNSKPIKLNITYSKI